MNELAKRLFAAELKRRQYHELAKTSFAIAKRYDRPRVLARNLTEYKQQGYEHRLQQLMNLKPQIRKQLTNLRDHDIALFARVAMETGESLKETLDQMAFYNDYHPKEKLPEPKAGPGSIDGSEVHYLAWQPPTERSRYIAGVDPIDSPGNSNRVTITLREKYYQPTIRADNGDTFSESECRLVGVEVHPLHPDEPPMLRINIPWPAAEGGRLDVWYTDNENTWSYFPTIAKQLNRPV